MRTELSASPCLTTRWAETIHTIATSTVGKAPLLGRQSHDKPVSFHNGLMDMCMCVCMCVHMWFKNRLFTSPQSPGAFCFYHIEWNNPFCVSATTSGIQQQLFSIHFLHSVSNSFTLTSVPANTQTSPTSSPHLPYSTLVCACQ